MSGLAGQRVLVTRAQDDLAPLAELLRARGAQPIGFPCIELAPPDGPELAALDAALVSISSEPPAAIALASPHAVECLVARLRALGLAPALLGRLLVAAAGEATARALEAHGVAAITPAAGAGAAPLARLLRERLGAAHEGAPGDGLHATHLRPGARVLLPQAAEATPLLASELRAAGLRVEPLVLYRTVAATRSATHDEGLRALRARGKSTPSPSPAGARSAASSRSSATRPTRWPRTRASPAWARSCAEVARARGFTVAAVGSSGLQSLLDALEAAA